MVEEILLLTTRCLIFAFAALAFARPYASASSSIVWIATALTAIGGIIAIAIAAATWSTPHLRKRSLIVASTLAAFAIISASVDGIRTAISSSRAGARDVAIIIDASSSMSIASRDSNAPTPFSLAKKAADDLIQSSPRNTAFTIILGSSVPEALTANPTSDRKTLFRLLDEASPLDGSFRAPDAIALAASVLSQGANANKQIIIFGDGQSSGWQLGDEQTWSFVRDILAHLPSPPRIIWRTLGLPSKLRNLTISNLSFSREIIGTDRDLRIDVTIANNGDESATASSLLLATEGKTYSDSSLGQLLPGQHKTISFHHRFRKTGTHPVRAILDVQDDLASDNALTQIAAVRSSMKVLVVEGSSAKRLSDRPGAFIALSLAPHASLINKPSSKKHPAAPNTPPLPNPLDPFLVHPTLISATDLPSIPDFSDFASIILADVPRLPTNITTRLQNYVDFGGGLLTVCASHANPDFYNQWTDPDGAPLFPLQLLGNAPSHASDGISIDPKTISHQAIAPLATDGDLATAVFENVWQSALSSAPHTTIGARLLNGDALFAERRSGKGRIIQFTTALDPSSGNLISRQSFLPMIHELTYYLARSVSPTLNIPASAGSTLTLGANTDFSRTESNARGLRAVYSLAPSSPSAIPSLLKVATEPANASQPNASFSINLASPPILPPASLPPNSQISAEWSGSIIVPTSRTYTFICHSNGHNSSASIEFLDNKRHFGIRRSKTTVDLTAGQRHDVIIRYSGPANGSINVRWHAPGIGEQPLSASWLSPLRTTQKDWSESFPATISSPRGPLPASIRLRQDSVSLLFPHRLSPGIYSAAIPAPFLPQLAEIATLSNQFANISFAIASDPSESILSPASPDELAFVSRFVPDFHVAASPDELSRALSGSITGRELWRRAAIPLLFLLIAEIFLTRWITRQRRIGEESHINFDDASVNSSSRFHEILKSMKGLR